MKLLYSLLFFAVASSYADVVPVTVYYESLCGDSIKFITKKLYPTYSQANFNFTTYLSNLTLVPYGHANITSDGVYNCQHGPNECKGNILHGCAVKHIKSETVLLEFINCLMLNNNKTTDYNIPALCVNNTNVPFDNIKSCFGGDEGKTIFKENADKTNEKFENLTFGVPYITFNNKLDGNVSKDAQNDFRKVLCAQNSLNNNGVCSDSSSSSIITINYILVSAVICFFFMRQGN